MQSILDRLRAIFEKTARIVVGLISGTSAYAIDVAVYWIPEGTDPSSDASGPR